MPSYNPLPYLPPVRSPMTSRLALVPLFFALVASAFAQKPSDKEADVSLHLLDVVIDAPWRVQMRPAGPNYVPVMFFFPETKDGWRRVKVLSLRISEVGSQGLSMLYQDTSASKPFVGSSATSPFTGVGLEVVNGFGETTTDTDIVRDTIEPGSAEARFGVAEINDENRGWHTIFRLPVPQAAVSGGDGRVTLLAQIEYRRVGGIDDRVYTVKRRMDVHLDPRPLPNFAGWWSYDTHLHTLAEFSTDLSYKAIRKAFGGPVQMVKECARAVGFIEHLEDVKGGVIHTDHNTFFSDREFVRYGPTTTGITTDGAAVNHPEISSYFLDDKGKLVPQGQREYENYQDIFGATFGEEITLHKSGGFFNFVSGTLGSHLLAYSTRHFMGPFHGGRFFIFRDEPNPNTLEHVLSLMATDEHFPNGFCYAAHPFSESRMDRAFLDAWNDDQINTAVHGAFIRKKNGRDSQFVFKGFELWNEKKTRYYATNTILPERVLALLEDPTQQPEWRNGEPNWDEGLNISLRRYHQAIADSLSVASGNNPAARFIRKFYMAAGTDAHGDFNRNSDMLGRGLAALPAIILRFLKVFSVSDNAFGKLRTVVESSTKGDRKGLALDSFASGRSVLTDGPVLEFRVDANGHYDGKTRKWHKNVAYEDDDGMIGGSGDMDGGRTMLVPEGGHDALVRFRMDTSPSFGGELERIELYRDEAGGKPKLVKVQRNTGEAKVLEPQGSLDPKLPADATGFRVAPLAATLAKPSPGGPVRALSAFALGGFTKRTAEPPYDHRVYTNPIWAVPVKLSVSGPGAVKPIPAHALNIALRFPVSMSATAISARLTALDESGDSVSTTGIPVVPKDGSGWGTATRENLATSVLTLTNGEPIPVPAGTAAWCLSVEGLTDMHRNVLNGVAWRVVLTPQGLVVDQAP